jgi:hypothetical protein
MRKKNVNVKVHKYLRRNKVAMKKDVQKSDLYITGNDLSNCVQFYLESNPMFIEQIWIS